MDGVTGVSTGTFAVGLSELTMLDVEVVVALAVVVVVEAGAE